ncbi:universal stress protein [Halogeometricum borinquense]|uniref:universal stress protein n=1 Tax=Halogeometricum borinquense TaxID=60847 RepID=UPI003438EFA4
MYDEILLTTDGTECSVQAAKHGLAFAEAFDATVRIITVINVQAAGGLFDAGGVTADYVESLESRGQKMIDEIADLAAPTTTVRTEVLKGIPSDSILEYAEDGSFDLVVLGTHGRTGVRRVLTGSVAEHVIRHADIPTLTVRERDERVEPSFERILVPTDGSEYAQQAVEHGLSVAEAFDATVHALYVIDTGIIAPRLEDHIPETVRAALETEGKTAIEAVESQARRTSVETVTSLTEGVPEREILAYADEHDIDLIAMGSHGRTGLDRFLLGSTTERVLRGAPSPVLSVRKPVTDE